MRVPPSQRVSLFGKAAASVRIYPDTRGKLKTLANYRGVTMAEMVDRLVDRELQAYYDEREAEQAQSEAPPAPDADEEI
jgi:hypothetical protein